MLPLFTATRRRPAVAGQGRWHSSAHPRLQEVAIVAGAVDGLHGDRALINLTKGLEAPKSVKSLYGALKGCIRAVTTLEVFKVFKAFMWH